MSDTTLLQSQLDRLRAGDLAARDELLTRACARLEQLTRKMLGHFARVRRWEETADVMQNAALRLYRTLAEVQPATPTDFFRLAALNIRRELLDLAKHYFGARGLGANYASAERRDDSTSQTGGPVGGAPDLTHEPSELAAWSEFHERAGQLPDEEREVFDLLWYQGLTQEEAAQLLAVSERTVKRRWQSARLQLFEALGGNLPE